MKIAIPLFGTRVSPRFAYADRLLLVEAENGEIAKKEIVPAGDSHPLRCVRLLVDLGVNVLICGGIDRFSEYQLGFHGVQIYSWVIGEVEEILENFLKGDLIAGPQLWSAGKWRGSKGLGRGKGRCLKAGTIFNKKEVIKMPRRDGTGPGGKGPGTGRGMGPCKGGVGRGTGQGRGQGIERGRGQGTSGNSRNRPQQ